GLFVALCVGLAVYAVVEFGTVKANVLRMTALSDNSTRALEITEYFEKMRRSILRYAYDNDEPSLKENGEVANLAISALQAAEKATLSDERRKIYQGLQAEVAAVQKKSVVLAEVVNQTKAGKAKLFASGDNLTASTQKILDAVRAGGDQSS